MTNTTNQTFPVRFFDDIRPYDDSEIPAAMKRIAQSELFHQLAEFVFPEKTIEEVASILNEIKTTDEFQHRVMYHFNRSVIRRSIRHFTCKGLEHISPDKAYMFVSNHRDIVLDASLLQNALTDHGLPTTEITFGANLMCHPLIIDIGKSNKMFRVERGGTAREFYRSSLHLSQYMRNSITHKKASVWIAQRNGRTKNGIDATDQGLINMFAISGGRNKIHALAELNIVPVAVSYEWEPCDILKACEIYETRRAKYVKRPGEDIESIVTGILQPKGNVHFQVCNPIETDELAEFESLPPHDAIAAVAKLIDRRIIGNYKLTRNNRIAHDLMNNASKPSARYTLQEKADFIKRMNRLSESEQREIFLGIYANPVNSKRTIK